MNISYLNEFLTLAEGEGFEKAAEQLYTTQSTLSKHIKKMENELGVILFDRSTRNVKISAQGKLLLPYAQQIRQLEQQYLATLADHARLTQQTLVIGSVNNIIVYGISDILVSFQQKYPNCKIDISGGSPYEVYQKLCANQLDLAFLRYTSATDLTGLSVVPFAEDEIVMVCSKFHPMAKRQVVSMGELRNEKILLFTANSFMYDFVRNACLDAGFEPDVALTVHRTENLIELTTQEMGICFLMKKHISNYANPNMVSVDICPPYKCRIDLCHSQDRKLSSSANSFLKLVAQWLKSNPLPCEPPL